MTSKSTLGSTLAVRLSTKPTHANTSKTRKETNQLQIIHLLAIYDKQGVMTTVFFDAAAENEIKIDMDVQTKRKWSVASFAAKHGNLTFLQHRQHEYNKNRGVIKRVNINLKTNNGRDGIQIA